MVNQKTFLIILTSFMVILTIQSICLVPLENNLGNANIINVQNRQVKIMPKASQMSVINKQDSKSSKTSTQQSKLSPQKINTITSPLDFISRWDTKITSGSSSNIYQVTLPLISSGIYNFNVSWGDGNSNNITSYNQAATTHTYAVGGNYTITISGILDGWNFGASGDNVKIIEISQWGTMGFGNNAVYAFLGSENLVLTARDEPNLTSVTSLVGAFEDCKSLGSAGDMNAWNTAGVTDMSNMFNGDSNFNQSIYSWDVSHVTSMNSMFTDDKAFNQPLDAWNVSQVTDMTAMFYDDFAFNQPIGSWDVSHVTSMFEMLAQDPTFNQPLANWNVSSVTSMYGLFFGDTAFNQPIGLWDVSHATDMSLMFENATSFNQNLGAWDVSKVTSFVEMFSFATLFDQPLLWDVNSLRNATYMFYKVGLSITNYDSMLNYFSHIIVQKGVVFDAGNSMYSSASIDARSYLINKYDWTFIDGGQATLSSAPTSVTATSGNNSVFLSWGIPSNPGILPIISYHIYRSITGNSYTHLATAYGTSYNDTSALNGVVYYYYVEAVNSLGESIPSLEVEGISNSSSSTSSKANPSSPGFEFLFMLLGFLTLLIVRRKWHK